MYISYYLPPQILTNEILEFDYSSPDWTSSKIYSKTGIKSRHVVQEELVSDIAILSAEKLFHEHKIDRDSVDFLILCTQSPDYFLPTTACIIQERLALSTRIGAFDFNLGCSGYVYGLAMSKALLSTKMAQRILLITSETYSRFINHMDKSTRTIFGDAATSTLLETVDVDNIGEFVLGTDGKGAPNLIVPAGGLARRSSIETAEETQDYTGSVRSLDNLFMNGIAISAFILECVPNLVMETISKNSISIDDVDYFVFHQANSMILEKLRDKLSIPTKKFCIDIEKIGNTVSSTIPIALRNGIDNGSIKKGMNVLTVGFGVGYSWGATLLKF